MILLIDFQVFFFFYLLFFLNKTTTVPHRESRLASELSAIEGLSLHELTSSLLFALSGDGWMYYLW